MSEPTISLRAIIKDETASQLSAMNANLRQVGDAAGLAGRSFGVLDAESAKLSAALQDQIIKLKAQKELLSDPVYVKSAQQAAQLKKEVQDLTDGLSATNKATEKHGITWSEVVSKYYIASQAIGVLRSGMMSLVEASSKYELLQARLASVEGSSALGMRDFKEVQELAKKPGLGFEEAASTFATLRGMKVTAAEAKTLINGIAQANASAAGTAEQFGRVMYQIQQSVSLGRLMAEDLRPIQQAIPTLGAAMQEHFGATQAEQLNKILEKSGKSVRDFWLEVAELGSKLPSTGETIANNMDNMGDAWTRFKAALTSTDAIKGATRAMAGLIEKVAEFLEKDQSLERSYLVRTKVVTQVQQQEAAKYGGVAPALPAGLLHGDSTLTAKIIAQGNAAKAAADFAAASVKKAGSIWSEAVSSAQADIDRQAAKNEAKDKAAQAGAGRKAAAARAAKAGESLKAQLARHDKASAANVIFSGPNEVTMRGGMDWATDDPEGKISPWYERISGGDEGEQAKGLERREEGRRKAEQKRLADEKKLHEEVIKISKDRIEENQKLERNAQKIRMDWESALIEKKRQAHEEEMKLIRERFDVGQKLASDQVYKMLQGEFTIQGAVNATKDVMFRAFADTTTKWIEEQLIKMVFSKGAQAEETATAVAQASVVGAAWAAPSMATSIATFGGSTATGSAAWFTAMTAAQGYSVMPHARGGAVFGPVSASREEAFAPFVPGRIVPSYNSTTNHNTTNAQSITIHVHGGDEKTILRTLRKAGINGAGVSRS